MTVFLPLIHVVMSDVLNVVSMRGVRASVAERPRGGSALLFGGIGKDMVGAKPQQKGDETEMVENKTLCS
jgi:hypothetical protein